MTDNPIPTRAPAADVVIPQAAYDAADRYFANKSDDDDLLGAVDAAAPHIVAAELRRIAVMFESNAVGESGSVVRADAAYLRQRADELDGGAR